MLRRGVINHADLSDYGRRKKRVTLSVSDHARSATFVEHTHRRTVNVVRGRFRLFWMYGGWKSSVKSEVSTNLATNLAKR